MKFGLIILLAAAGIGRAQAPQVPAAADELAKHSHWDRLLIQPAAPAGPARLWQHAVWPWLEMIGGSDPDSALLATLAAGAAEAPASIDPGVARKTAWRSARPDGVLVRPDLDLTPTEMSVLPGAVAAHEPMVAWACTDHAGQRTAYVFCYDRQNHPVQASFTPKECGFSGSVMVLNRVTGEAWREPADEDFQAPLDVTGEAYFEIAPVRVNGLVFFGDPGKFVSNGKQRIAQITEIVNGVAVTVTFAPGEHDVTLFGFAAAAPQVRAKSGTAGEVNFNAGNGRYSVLVSAPPGGSGLRSAEVEINGGPPPPPRPSRKK